MDLIPQSYSDFDNIADPVDTSYLQDFSDLSITDYLTGQHESQQAPVSSIEAGMSDYVNAKPTFEAANQGMSFDYEGSGAARYADSKYNALKGFSPELGKQNEYRYAAMQDWGDTMSNAVSGAYRLGAQTFIDGWKGWGRMADSLIHLDASRLVGSPEDLYKLNQEQTEIMNKYAIYASEESENSIFSKQLLGNMIQQSGFAIGATAQFLSEELLTMGLGSAFSLSKLGLGASLKGVKGVYKAGEMINDAKKLGDIWKSEGLMRTIWEGAKRAAVGKDVLQASRAGASTLQLASMGLGGIKRTLAEMNMAMTEARMEAAGTYGDLYNRMYNEHVARTGQQPAGMDLEKMKNTALDAAQQNFAVNAGVLAVMNRLQFDNLFSKFGPERRILKQFGNFADDVVKVTGKAGEKELTQIAKKGLSGLKDIATTFGKKQAAWEGTKQLGRTMMKWEAAEGIQELIQEGSNVAIQDYYYDLYNDNPASWGKSIGAGAESQFSQEGIKTFLMGALTGRLISPITSTFSKGMDLVNTTAEQRAERKTSLEDSIATINHFYQNPQTALSEAVANFKVQNKAAESMSEALEYRSEYYYNNAKDSALAKLVSAAKKTNMLESVLDTVREYGNNMDAEQLKQAFPTLEGTEQNIKATKEYFNKIADEVVAFSKNWEELNDKFGDMVMPELYPEGSEDRKKAQIAQMAVHHAIEILATNRYKGERAIERMQKIYSEVSANTVIGASSAAAFRTMGADANLLAEIDLVTKELMGLNALETKDADTKKQIAHKTAELEALNEWKELWLPEPDKDAGLFFRSSDLQKAYAKYIDAKNTTLGVEQAVSATDMEQSWASFMDYVGLNKDNQQYVEAYNTLANPIRFTDMVNKSSEAIGAVLNRLKDEAIAKLKEAAKESTPKKSVKITVKDKNGKEFEVELIEGNRYITESDPKKRLSPKGNAIQTYNQDILKIESIGDDSVTVTINDAAEPVTYTMEEFIDRAGRIWNLNTMPPAVRLYFMNRDKAFTLNVRAKTGKFHLVGGKHAQADYSAKGVTVQARLELVMEDGKQVLKIAYINPVTKKKELATYNPIYLKKYKTGQTDLTSYPELDAELAEQSAKNREQNLKAQLDLLEELITEQEALIDSTKAASLSTRGEIDDLKKELADFVFVAEELEKIKGLKDTDSVKYRNQLKKLVDVKKISEVKDRVIELKAKITELEDKRDQLESEMQTIESLYEAYLEAQEELTQTGEAFDRNGNETIYTETENQLNQLESTKLTSYIKDEDFTDRIDAIQAEKDIIDENINYILGVIKSLEEVLKSYTDYPDIMAVLGATESRLTAGTNPYDTARGKVSPELAKQMFDIDNIRKGLVAIKTAELRKAEPDKAKIQTIDYTLAGLTLDSGKVMNQDKLNAIDAVIFAGNIQSLKGNISNLLERGAQLQDKIDEWTMARAQREEINNLQKRVNFLKTIWEPLSKRAIKKSKESKAKRMLSQNKLKEDHKGLASLEVETDPAAPTYSNEKLTNFARINFQKNFGRHFVDQDDTVINTENGSDRFFEFSDKVAVTGQGFVFRVVTKENAERLGLTDILDLAYNENDIKMVVMKKVTNPDGTVGYAYVDKTGKILSEEDAKDVNNLVYNSMTDISKWDVARVREQKVFAVDASITDAQIEKVIADHAAYQKSVTERSKDTDVHLNITGSTSGKQNVQRLANGALDRTELEGRIVEENPDYTAMYSVSNPNNLVELRVSTSDDQAIAPGILPGRLVMQEFFFDANGNKVRTEKVTRVFNRELTQEEKDNIIDVLKRFTAVFGKANQPDEATKAEAALIFDYLKNILAWGVPKEGKPISERFFWVKDGLHRGTQVIDFSEAGIEVNREALLEGIFHHVHAGSLKKNQPFNTIKIVDGKAVVDKSYKSYVEYLLAKREDGQVPPVYTSLPRYQEGVPQRKNVNLTWQDPAVAAETKIAVPAKAKATTAAATTNPNGLGPVSAKYVSDIDGLLAGTIPTIDVGGVVFKVVDQNGGKNITFTRKVKGKDETAFIFPGPFQTFDQLKPDDVKKYIYDAINQLSGYQYGKRSAKDGLVAATPAAPVTAAPATPAAQAPAAAPKLTTASVGAPAASQANLIRVATKIAAKQQDPNAPALNLSEKIIYDNNKAAIDQIVANANIPSGAAKPVTTGNVNPVSTTPQPTSIRAAVAAATQQGNMLSAIVYEKTADNTYVVKFGAQVPIDNGNVEVAKNKLEYELKQQQELYIDQNRMPFQEVKQTEDFKALATWMAKNLPNVPMEIVGHLIDNRAWGKFYNGAVYIYDKAELGTGFHEAFEAVWASFLTDSEQQDLAKEFRSREGEFTNPFSKQTKKFSEANMYDVREMLAEEFRSYVLNKTEAPVSKKIKSFFQKLWDFIKKILGLSKEEKAEMLSGINKVFKAIDTGKYAKATPIRELHLLAPVYRAVGGFTQQETADLLEGMQYYFFRKVYDNGGNIDSLLGDLNKKESGALFRELYHSALESVKANAALLDETYPEMIDAAADAMKREFQRTIGRYGLMFDEDSFAKEDTAVDTLGIKDAMSIDPRQATKTNIKLLLASLPVFEMTEKGAKAQKNEMLQPKLVDFDRTMILLLNELGNTVTFFDKDGNQMSAFDQMIQKLDDKYLVNGQYRKGYSWIAPLKERLKYGQAGLTLEDKMLQVAFTSSFTNVRVAPEKLIVGEEGNLYSFNPLVNVNVDRIRDTWANNVKDNIHTGGDNLFKVGLDQQIEFNRESAKYAALVGALNNPSAITLEKALALLEEIGVKFSDTLEGLRPYTADILEQTKSILGMIKDQQVNNVSDLFGTEVIRSRMNKLLALEGMFSGEENILSYQNASGQAKYAVSIPSLFSNLINTINSVSSLEELVQTAPWLGSLDAEGKAVLHTYQQNSEMLRPGGILFDAKGRKKPGMKVTYHDITGVGMDEYDGVDTADLQFPDRVANKIHFLLKNVTFSNINSDKSTEFGIGISKGGEPTPMVIKMDDINAMLFRGGSKEIVDVFMRQLEDEMAAAVMQVVSPVNVEVYKDAVLNLGHFEDILKPSGLLAKFKKEVLEKKSTKNRPEAHLAFMKANEVALTTAISKYLNDRVEQTVEYLKDLDLFERLNNSNDYGTDAIRNNGPNSLAELLNLAPGQQQLTGVIDDVTVTRTYFTENNVKAIAAYLALNEEVMITEQHKMLYGHPSMYKDLPKRANGPTSAKEEMVQDPATIKWMDDNMARLDGKERSEQTHQLMKVITFQDQNVVSQFHQDLVDALGKEYADVYANLNEADAMAYGMPDMVRDILFQTGKISKDQLRQWEFEVAYEKLVRSGLMFRQDGTQMKKGDTGFTDKYSKEELEAAKAIVKKGDPGFIFQVLKTQYFGYAENGLMTHPVFLKHSVQPKFFRHVEGTAFEKLYLAAQENQVDVIGFESGEKVGNVTDANGKATPLYKEDGTVNVDGLNLPETLVQQQLYSRFFGIQVSTADYAKNKVVRGTQVTKLIMVNFYENGQPMNAEVAAIIEEYNDTLKKMMTLGKTSLLKELGLERQGDQYITKDLSKLVSLLRQEAESRDLPDNMIDAINAIPLIDGTTELEYAFDTLINKDKIDNILNSIVDSRVISEKMNGKAAIQVASTLYESDPRSFMVLRKGVYMELADAMAQGELTDKEKATIRMKSNDLKSYYRKDGSVQRMEVYINWPFEDATPEQLGLKLVNGVYRIPEGGLAGISNQLLEAIGFRIPTQSMNSIEAITIKGFVPHTNGDMVVVPADLVGKAGSDFDIDKLNIYLPNARVVNPKLGSKEFYDFIRENLKNKYGYADALIDQLFGFMDKSVMTRINEAAFTDNGKAYHETDESLVDIAAQIEGDENTVLSVLNDVKRSIQAFNKELRGKITIEYKEHDETKAGLQNKLISLMGELVLNPANFRQLVMPNNVDILSGLADEIVKLKTEAGTISKQNEKSRAYLRSFLGNSQIRERYLMAKRMVGISAVHSTFHAMAQVAGLRLTGSYDVTKSLKYLALEQEQMRQINIKLSHAKKNDMGEFLIGHKNDMKGIAISDSNSEATSGFVDGAKNPFVFDLNLSLNTAGTWFYLKHLAVPDEELAYFFAQPILDDYFKRFAKNKAMFKAANGRNVYNKELFYQTIAPFYKKLSGRDLMADYKATQDDIGAQLAFEKQLASYVARINSKFASFSMEDMKANILKGRNADPEFQIAVLYNYLEYTAQGRALSGYMQAISYDNKKTKTIQENNAQVGNWDRAVKTGFIANPEAILTSTFLGEMKEQKEDIFKMFEKFFVTLSPELKEVFAPMEDKISDPDFFASKSDMFKLLDRYQNFVVSYLLHTTAHSNSEGTERTLNNMYTDLMMGADSVSRQLLTFKLSNDPRISENLIVKELLPVLTEDTSKTNTVRLLRSRLDSLKVNKIIEATNQLKEYAVNTADKNLENFVDNLAILTILQSGVQSSSIDYKKVLPTQIYSELVKTILNKFMDNPVIDADNVWLSFHQNNWNNRSIVPKGPSYLKYKNGVIKVGINTSAAQNEFMVKYIIAPGVKYKDAKKMGKAGFKAMLFRRGESDGKKYTYNPVNLYGDGNRLLEIYTDGRDSIIPTNNVGYTLPGNPTGGMTFRSFAEVMGTAKAAPAIEISKNELLEDYSQATGQAMGTPVTVTQADQALRDQITAELPGVASETAKKHAAKEQVKTKVATQFIGEGKADSSTDRYKGLYAKYNLANTGEYNSSDVIFVASNGARGGAVAPVVDGKLQGAYKNMDLAIAVGAKFIMDTAAHLRSGSYNTGEKALAEYLVTKGYNRVGETGMWEKSTGPKAKTLRDLIKENTLKNATGATATDPEILAAQAKKEDESKNCNS